MSWEIVIGLETHLQLATHSKIFSAAATTYGAPPNTQACAVDLGLPGTLPVLNEAAVRMAIQFGLATQAHIARRCVFARKNYFYPDLPKGYQISQLEHPIIGPGQLDIELETGIKTIRITRAHLEEDAGKSLHDDFHGQTGIDLNRAGTPLLEVVTEPDLRSAKEAVAYLKTLHELVRCLGICDGNMQEGSFRCDANVSVRRRGETTLGTRTELKNLNSFRFIERAINHEAERQIRLLENGERVRQETRLYDSDQDQTRPMRSKEEANDYRYFPDPDLLPVIITEAQIQQLQATLPELPAAKRQRLQQQYGLSPYDVQLLSSQPQLTAYFEAVVAATGNPNTAKLAANWITVNLMGALNKANWEISQNPLSVPTFATLLNRIQDNTISGKAGKQVFEILWAQGGNVDDLIAQHDLKQETNSNWIEALVMQVIADSPQQVAQYQAGKEKLLGFFVGSVMKQSKGKADPEQISQLVKSKLQR